MTEPLGTCENHHWRTFPHAKDSHVNPCVNWKLLDNRFRDPGRPVESVEAAAPEVCKCGHTQQQHDGHTHIVGTPAPDHCSQLCGCKHFQLATVEAAAPATPLVIRCSKCKGTVIYKRLDNGEIEVIHSCSGVPLGAEASESVETRRQEFEAWAVTHWNAEPDQVERVDDIYKYSDVGMAWDAWQAAAAELREKLEAANRELQMIDEALARRPALADAPNRYTKVYRACEVAGKSEALEADNQRLRKALAEVGNLSGGPTMNYSPEIERKELLKRLPKIAEIVSKALTEGNKNG